MPRITTLLLIVSATLCPPGPAASSPARASAAEPEPPRQIEIGVLSHRGERATEQRWGATADYLTRSLPRHCFSITPLPFDQVEPAVAAGRVDFLLVNPALYVDLEVKHRISRIATMRDGIGAFARNRLGGVLFTRADHARIETVADLRGQRLLAVDPDSLGGYLAARAVLDRHGLHPERDLAALEFAGTHDAVVLAVRAGEADAGIVGTDILEQMAREGAVDLAEFRVLNPRQDEGFPLLHSTALYPEWPFSTLRDTSERLAQQVAVALLQMPRDESAALAGGYSGWTVPLDYQPVHALLRALQRPPYDQPEPFTLGDAAERYWPALVLGTASLLVMAILLSRLHAANTRLNRAKSCLEQHQELILDSVAEGIYGVDLEGRTTFVNKAVEQLTGWRAEELIGRDQHRMLHVSPGDAASCEEGDCPVRATLRDQRPRLVDDGLFWRRDGSSFPVEYSSAPIRDEQGRTIGSVVVFRDNTERQVSAERIRRLEVEQTRIARLTTLGEMTSGIAHEVNQPLTAITTNARACMRLFEDGRGSVERCNQVMGRIAEQADRAGEIIRHLRRHVRDETPDLHPISVARLCDTVMVLLRQEAAQHRVRMSCDVAEDVGAVIAQRTQIEQVILNLARNAIEAMADRRGERRLRLSAHAIPAEEPPAPAGAVRPDRSVVIAVEDTGPGVTGAVRERLFEPFVTTKPEGLGLGLSISAGIIAKHGSRLCLAEPQHGCGARFEFTLPVATDETGAPHREDEETR